MRRAGRWWYGRPTFLGAVSSASAGTVDFWRGPGRFGRPPSNFRLKPQEQPSQLILAPSDKEYEEADLDLPPLRSFPVAGFKFNIVNICFYNFVEYSVTNFCSASWGWSGSSSGTAASRITRGCPPLSASTWTSTRGQGAHRWMQGHDILVNWNGSQHLSICPSLRGACLG